MDGIDDGESIDMGDCGTAFVRENSRGDENGDAEEQECQCENDDEDDGDRSSRGHFLVTVCSNRWSRRQYSIPGNFERARETFDRVRPTDGDQYSTDRIDVV